MYIIISCILFHKTYLTWKSAKAKHSKVYSATHNIMMVAIVLHHESIYIHVHWNIAIHWRKKRGLGGL